jgi:hypothetical protein
MTSIMNSLEEYVQAAAVSIAKLAPQPHELFEDEVADEPYRLFMDLGHSYSIPLWNLRLACTAWCARPCPRRSTACRPSTGRASAAYCAPPSCC